MIADIMIRGMLLVDDNVGIWQRNPSFCIGLSKGVLLYGEVRTRGFLTRSLYIAVQPYALLWITGA